MSFAADELTRDGFLDGRLRLWQPKGGYRAAIDPVLLAAFVDAKPGERVLDLGCGAGAAALCLGVRVPGLELHGLEVQADYAGLARRNAAENGIALSVHDGDVRDPPAALRRLVFDQVLSNPPYHDAASAPAADPGRDRAHRETAPLADWVDAALRRLVAGGRLAMIQHPDRLGDLLAALRGRVGALDLLPVAPRAGKSATRVLLRARKARGKGLRIWPPLILHQGLTHTSDRESYGAEATAVLRGLHGLLSDTR
jgi:tRNA1Val (adenine37-N6)-methyltransferase